MLRETGRRKKTFEKTASNGANRQTDRQTDGHRDSKIDSAQWADSVKRGIGLCCSMNKEDVIMDTLEPTVRMAPREHPYNIALNRRKEVYGPPIT